MTDLIDRFYEDNRELIGRLEEEEHRKWMSKGPEYFNPIMGKMLTDASFTFPNDMTLTGVKPTNNNIYDRLNMGGGKD